MKKKVIITEEQLKFLVEDVRYTNNNGQINMSIGQSRDDKDNIGLNKTDTRVFGNRKNLLYGDGTTSKHVMNLNDLVLQRRANLVIYQNLIDYVKNGRKGPIFTDHNVAKTTVTAINKWLATLDDEEILRKATEAYNRTKFTNQQKDGLFDRIINSDNTDKIARYTSFTIPGTNVPCIALFAMDNFDLSDAIKKGSLRDTSVIWNSGKLGNPEDFNPVNGRIPVTYDNGVIPNIEQNFSLNGLDDINKTKNRDHFKNVQQYQDANNYTTINQFLDKSIMYASYALNKEGYRPDYIITVPSSSKMNYYYSTNLSNKMGIPYIPDFFQKNIINAHLKNGITDEYLQEQGMPPAKIMELKDSIKRYAYKEMVYEIEAPIRNVVNEYFELFSYISKTKNSREKATISDVIRIFSKHCFNVIKNEITNDNILGKYLVHNLLNQKSYLPEEKNILNSILFIVQYKIGKKVFANIISEMFNIFKQYQNELMGEGVKIKYGADQSKITSIKKEYRNYVEGSFIIADENLSQNGQLLNRLKNGKFLIIDEDVNSGASFKLAIDALREKLPENPDINIVCLANGFSENGL